MKHLLLFGAGKSASVLIGFLGRVAEEKGWRITVADADIDAARAKTSGYSRMEAVGIDILDDTQRTALIRQSHAVISLLPPALHYRVAVDCVAEGKHLLTASYLDDNMKRLASEVRSKELLFLCEMGLDPGIDHMSAMQLLTRIREQGGEVHTFRSHCGGLVAPESDTNPWHYKISWNPRNIILAGKAGAVYRENGQVKERAYPELFASCEEVEVEGVGTLAFYPNRDSLSYAPLYGLDNAETFIRTTLRHPVFCSAWNLVVQAGLTDEQEQIDTDGLSLSSFLRNAFAEKKVTIDAPLQPAFDFLGWNDPSPIGKGVCTRADALQAILEQKWKLGPHDKDMIVMLHEVGYRINGKNLAVQSELVVKGDDPLYTAMAKTVGLPLGIAATLLLEGKIVERGVQIPILPGIYEPVLAELERQGIRFAERHV